MAGGGDACVELNHDQLGAFAGDAARRWCAHARMGCHTGSVGIVVLSVCMGLLYALWSVLLLLFGLEKQHRAFALHGSSSSLVSFGCFENLSQKKNYRLLLNCLEFFMRWAISGRHVYICVASVAVSAFIGRFRDARKWSYRNRISCCVWLLHGNEARLNRISSIRWLCGNLMINIFIIIFVFLIKSSDTWRCSFATNVELVFSQNEGLVWRGAWCGKVRC